jgi:hypothetical protein
MLSFPNPPTSRADANKSPPPPPPPTKNTPPGKNPALPHDNEEDSSPPPPPPPMDDFPHPPSSSSSTFVAISDDEESFLKNNIRSKESKSNEKSISFLVSLFISIVICVVLQINVFSKYEQEVLTRNDPSYWSRPDSFSSSSSRVKRNSNAEHYSSNSADVKSDSKRFLRPFSFLSIAVPVQSSSANLNAEFIQESFFEFLASSQSDKSRQGKENENFVMIPKLEGWHDLLVASSSSSPFLEIDVGNSEKNNQHKNKQVKDDDNEDTQFFCVGWKQTADCDPDSGARLPQLDKGCSSSFFETGISGFCDCFDLVKKIHVREAKLSCVSSSFSPTCQQVCQDSATRKHLDATIYRKSLPSSERSLLFKRLDRRNGLLLGQTGNKIINEDDVLLQTALTQRKARLIDFESHINQRIHSKQKDEEKTSSNAAADFAIDRAHLFRKMRGRKIFERNVHQFWWMKKLNGNRQDEEHQQQQHLLKHKQEELAAIENFVGGGFGGSDIDAVYEEDVDERVRKSL